MDLYLDGTICLAHARSLSGIISLAQYIYEDQLLRPKTFPLYVLFVIFMYTCTACL